VRVPFHINDPAFAREVVSHHRALTLVTATAERA